MVTSAQISKELALALRRAVYDCKHAGGLEANCPLCKDRWRLIDQMGGADLWPVIEGRVIARGLTCEEAVEAVAERR